MPALTKRIELAECLSNLRAISFWAAASAGVGGDDEHIAAEVLRASSRRPSSVPVMATRAPSSRKRRAVASPMPLVPPVISVALFCSLDMTTFLFRLIPVRSGRKRADGNLDGCCRSQNQIGDFAGLRKHSNMACRKLGHFGANRLGHGGFRRRRDHSVMLGDTIPARLGLGRRPPRLSRRKHPRRPAGPCVVAMTLIFLAGRSCEKCLAMPSSLSQRYRSPLRAAAQGGGVRAYVFTFG